MDPNSFDRFSRALATSTNRRTAIPGVTSVLAALITRLTPGAISNATAQPRICRPLGRPCFPDRGLNCCRGATCQDGRCQCPKRTRRCGNRCLPKRKCCHHRDCFHDQRCTKGRCRCRAGQKRCQKRCIPRSACCRDRECGRNEACVRGACDCARGAKRCEEGCVPADACCQDSDCGENGACIAGVCDCVTGFKPCDGTCIPSADCCQDSDCGQHGVCEQGGCVCATGFKVCGEICIPENGCCVNSDCGPDENCEDHICVAKRCGTGAPCRVFTTSGVWTGDLRENGQGSGIDGADAKCQAAAVAGGLSGTYRAWITGSHEATAPSQRFTNLENTGPYILVDAAGTVIANNWADLTTLKGTDYLRAQINITEFGTVTENDAVWTNTLPDGTRVGTNYTCVDWSTTAASGQIGLTDETDQAWTSPGWFASCALPLMGLYCFEQG